MQLQVKQDGEPGRGPGEKEECSEHPQLPVSA